MGGHAGQKFECNDKYIDIKIKRLSQHQTVRAVPYFAMQGSHCFISWQSSLQDTPQ